MKWSTILSVLAFHTSTQLIRASQETKKLSSICETQPALSLTKNDGPKPSMQDSTSNGYQTWVANHAITSTYPHSIFLPMKSNPCKGMAVHWKIQKSPYHEHNLDSTEGPNGPSNGSLHIAMAVEASGWISLGFSETGGMNGADLVYYQSSTGKLVDAYVTDGYVKPTDDEDNDWTLHQVTETNDGILIVQASRSLDSGDILHDRKIVDDSSVYVMDTILIGAWGNGDMFYHGHNRVSSSVQLFPGGDGAGDPRLAFEKDMKERSEGSVTTLQLDNYEIPSNETTYHRVCYTHKDLVDNGLFSNSSLNPNYIIGFEFHIAPQSAPYAHHILIYGHLSAANSPDECSRENLSVPILGWAPGVDYFHFHNGGLEVGNTYNALTVEYHFDNPNGIINVIDDGTGVDIYYSNNPPELKIGMFVLGDYTLNLMGKPVGDGKSMHEFTCPQSCTNTAMGNDEITILMESHHMHQAGKRMTTQVIRNNDTIINHAKLEYYDFDQRGSAPIMQKPYIVKKGDAFRTTCYYESRNKEDFGLGSRDEMCMSFMYYYPKQNNLLTCGLDPGLGACAGTYENVTLSSDSNFGRLFGLSVTVDPPITSSPNNNEDHNGSLFIAAPAFKISILLCFCSLIML